MPDKCPLNLVCFKSCYWWRDGKCVYEAKKVGGDTGQPKEPDKSGGKTE